MWRKIQLQDNGCGGKEKHKQKKAGYLVYKTLSKTVQLDHFWDFQILQDHHCPGRITDVSLTQLCRFEFQIQIQNNENNSHGKSAGHLPLPLSLAFLGFSI